MLCQAMDGDMKVEEHSFSDDQNLFFRFKVNEIEQPRTPSPLQQSFFGEDRSNPKYIIIGDKSVEARKYLLTMLVEEF